MSLVSFVVIYAVFFGPQPSEATGASDAAKGERFVIFAGSIIAALVTLVYSLAFIVHMLKRKVTDAFERAAS